MNDTALSAALLFEHTKKRRAAARRFLYLQGERQITVRMPLRHRHGQYPSGVIGQK